MNNLFIRPMREADLSQVMEIERVTFTTPWDLDAFETELHKNEFAHYYIIGQDERIFGYCGLWVVYEAAQITNIAILPEYRGNNYGDRLFAHVVKESTELNAKELSLEVRISNIVAQKLYRKYGMVPVGVRKNYYVDNQEDAIVMWVKL
ncbi:ribosomal protein S18-alanine N-acetyltransferase [Salinibacillus xinjiangensis]|uniref:[Ribosomal protein bS18]-alanine N-acetyltransferase n=1 Tax=Salinibacillus xinjiangensis TaxID=1229268 RepID=A0A6G1X8L1_9BACI|nr:ribosomal protein S18-alanine N-acetyltransferase [Salinibacillus xinjiangensis]MRG87343.1 ribosomal-protein-alanine N-acetyltransferase [Salinibacillus xinjiangensis]